MNIEFYTPPSVLFTLITSFTITLVVGFIFYKLLNKILPYLSKPLLEKYIADILPFYAIHKHKYLKLKNGSYASVIALSGVNYSSLSGNQHIQLTSLRQQLLNNLGLEGAHLEFFVSKSKANLNLNNKSANQSSVLNQIFSKVYLKASGSYQVNYFIYCIAKNLTDTEKLNNQVLASFAFYNAKILKKHSLLRFLYKNINHFDYKNLIYGTNNIQYQLSATKHSFNESNISLENNHIKNLHCTIFSLNFFPSEASSSLINAILQLSCKLEIKINAKIFENTKALANLELWKRMTFLTKVKALEFYELSELLQSCQESLINTNFSVYLYSNTKEELELIQKEFTKIYTSLGFNFIKETKGAEIAYFNRLLGFNNCLRNRPITSSNLACLLNFNKSFNGLNKCDWGKYPLAYFNNIDGSLYKLFLHISEESEAVAHSVAFAPTGSGKTFLFQHIIAGVLYHYNNVNIYAFDKLSGMKVFTNAVNGKYLSLKQDPLIELNPLLLNLEDEENTNFLANWFEITTQLNDNETKKLINTAIKIIKALPIKERRLTNLGMFFPQQSAIYKALEPFAFGVHKSLFNGKQDSLNLKDSNFINFDMTQILEDANLSSSVVAYIMYKIRKHAKLTGLAHLVFIDETSSMLKNKVFAKYIEVLLKEHRKLRGSVNIVFQDVKDIEKLSVKETVLNQCKTRFIFKNIEANRQIYQETLELNDKQIDIIKGTNTTGERMLMVQKGNKITVLNTDLSYLGNLSKFYASSVNKVKLMEELKQKYGKNWQEEYLKSE